MNNRYLYRAKRKNWRELPKEKCWVEGYYAYIHPYHCIIQKDNFDSWIAIDEKTLCACTGLKDDNENLIWENDIVKVGWQDNEAQAEEIRKVTWSRNGYYPWSDEFCCDGCVLFNEIMFVEVIGSAFDNPELLEV